MGVVSPKRGITMNTNITENRNTDHDKKMLSLVYQMAAFIGSKRFLSLYKKEECRFDIDGKEDLFQLLRVNLAFQLRAAVPYDQKKRLGNSATYHEVPVDEIHVILSNDWIALADKIAFYINVDLKASDMKFTVKRGELLLDKVFSMIGGSRFYGLCQWLHALERPGCSLRTFEMVNALSELGKFVTSIETLANSTGLPGYEVMLLSLANKPYYFGAKGYPHDILCHDRVAVSEKDHEYVGIAADKAYPASRLLNTNSKVPENTLRIFDLINNTPNESLFC